LVSAQIKKLTNQKRKVFWRISADARKKEPWRRKGTNDFGK
jgi:hypothetical protein